MPSFNPWSPHNPSASQMDPSKMPQTQSPKGTPFSQCSKTRQGQPHSPHPPTNSTNSMEINVHRCPWPLKQLQQVAKLSNCFGQWKWNTELSNYMYRLSVMGRHWTKVFNPRPLELFPWAQGTIPKFQFG